MQNRRALVVATMLLLPGSIAHADGVLEVQGPKPIQAGTRWVIAELNRGSFGWMPRKYLVEALGERTWHGQAVTAFVEGDTTTFVDRRTYGLVARLRRGALLETFEPPFAWEWPIAVGKRWETRFRYTDHEQSRTVEAVRARFTVEAYEDVVVPAGQFKVLRIVWDTLEETGISWWSPEIGVTVRAAIERTAEHPLGRGTRESEMILYETPWSRPTEAE